MKLKYKAMFIAIVTLVDLMVIVFVVMNNDKTNIKNDVSNKTAANILSDSRVEYTIPDIENKISDEQPQETEPEQKAEQEAQPKEEVEQEPEIIEETVVEEQPTVEIDTTKPYDEMTIEEREIALNNGTLQLEYSNVYTNSPERLTVSRGAIANFNGHKETYYSERVLPGTGLNIPGRHVADDGTVRDGDGYICVAANQQYMQKGTILITSLGPAKVYDTGCAEGIIDIYVNW